MPLLDDQAREEIGQLFQELEAPIRLVFFTQPTSPLVVPGRQECLSCEEAQQLVDELVELSDKLELEVHDVRGEPQVALEAGVDKVPALLLRGPAQAGAVRFFGLPSGYEFSTLIADIVDLSKGNIHLAEKTRSELDGLEGPVHIQVFVTPT